MNEPQAMSLSLKGRFNDVRDDEVQDHPRMVAALADVAQKQSRFDALREAWNALGARIVEVEHRRDALAGEIQAIDAERADLALRIVSGAADDKMDRLAQQRRADLARQLALYSVALDALRERLQEARVAMVGPGDENSRAKEALDRLRRDLRLELAMQRDR